jgi:hypothetical protein
MDTFNYLSVLVSIILGLGITQLLSALGRSLEYRDRDRLYWPSIAWFGVLLLAHIQTWWSFFGLRDHTSWNFLQFVFVLLQPIGLYLLSVLTLPSPGSDSTNLKKWYFANRRVFFMLMMVFLVLSLMRDLVISGSLPESKNLFFHVVFFIASLVATLTANERFHKAMALFAVASFASYIYFLFNQLIN